MPISRDKQGATTTWPSHPPAPSMGGATILYGTIGNGTTKNSDVPTLTDLPDGVTATDLIAGGNRAHVLTASGQMYDWGSLENGENIDLRPQVDALPSGQIPVALFDGPDAEQYLALMEPNAGSAYAWGDDDSGQLGVGSYTDSTHWEASDMPAGRIATAWRGRATATSSARRDSSTLLALVRPASWATEPP